MSKCDGWGMHPYDCEPVAEKEYNDLGITPISEPREAALTRDPSDDEAAAHARRMAELTQHAAALHASLEQSQRPQEPQQLSFEEILEHVDPRDSAASKAMYAWLTKNGRLHKAGTLDGVGYLFIYQEPKGTTGEGWAAGGTVGDRIVEEALTKAGTNGKTERGLCSGCFSVIEQAEGSDQPVLQDAQDDEDPRICPGTNGSHVFAG